MNENSVGGFSLKVSSEAGKIGGRKTAELGHLEFIRTPESCSKGAKTTNSQKWKCPVTGYISGPGPLSCYQRARGIDTSLRERVKIEGPFRPLFIFEPDVLKSGKNYYDN
ncbi:MAG: hypothetical protein GY880_32635 [Planctomycetaceae bacterium]|nr:hypothetical protein [Planctomycetaceae bacterium]